MLILFDKEFYLLTELEEIFNCSKNDLSIVLEIASDRVPIFVKTEPDWWFWDCRNSKVSEPVQGVRYVEIYDYSNVEDIFNIGAETVTCFESAELSSNRYLPGLGVLVTYSHLAVSQDGLVLLTRPQAHIAIQSTYLGNLSKPEEAEFFPRILNTETKLKPIHQDKPTIPDEYISDYLALLNKAAFEFWSSADPDEKTTHPTNEQVMSWLKKQGFSDINAKQGAVIIRPEWAANGRRPTK